MTPCPDDNTLTMMLQGQLTPTQTRHIQAHADACASCSELLSELFSILPSSNHQPDTPQEPVTPLTMGRYVISRLLGAGAMGAVFEAWDPDLERKVALKLLRPDRFADDVERACARARLLREARALARLDHPNLLSIYDVGEYQQDRVFLASAYVDGQTIDLWAKDKHWTQIVACYEQACAGLEHAHQQGIIHRDIKPQNILIDHSDRVRVCDFGLASASPNRPAPQAQSIFKHVQLTYTHAILGTPAYMAPEQLDGQPVDATADQYSLCAALYEAVYGFRPYMGATLEELTRSAKQGELTKPQSAQVPNALFDVLSRGLRPRAQERFESMDVLCDHLVRVRTRALEPNSKLHRWLLVPLALTLMLMASMLILDWLASSHDVTQKANPLTPHTIADTSVSHQNTTVLKEILRDPEPVHGSDAHEHPGAVVSLNTQTTGPHKVKKAPVARALKSSSSLWKRAQTTCQLAGHKSCDACVSAMTMFMKKSKANSHKYSHKYSHKNKSKVMLIAAQCAYKKKRCDEAITWFMASQKPSAEADMSAATLDDAKAAVAQHIGRLFPTCPLGFELKPVLRAYQAVGVMMRATSSGRSSQCISAWKHVKNETSSWRSGGLGVRAKAALMTALKESALCIATSDCDMAKSLWQTYKVLHHPHVSASTHSTLFARTLPECVQASDDIDARVERIIQKVGRAKRANGSVSACIKLWGEEQKSIQRIRGEFLNAKRSDELDRTLVSWAKCVAPKHCDVAPQMLSYVRNQGLPRPDDLEAFTAIRLPSCVPKVGTARLAAFKALGQLSNPKYTTQDVLSTLTPWIAPTLDTKTRQLVERVLRNVRFISLDRRNCEDGERAYKLSLKLEATSFTPELWQKFKSKSGCT